MDTICAVVNAVLYHDGQPEFIMAETHAGYSIFAAAIDPSASGSIWLAARISEETATDIRDGITPMRAALTDLRLGPAMMTDGPGNKGDRLTLWVTGFEPPEAWLPGENITLKLRENAP